MGNLNEILTPEMIRELEEVIERLKNKTTPDSYWEKHEEEISKLKERNKKLYESIQMTPETYRKPFSI